MNFFTGGFALQGGKGGGVFSACFKFMPGGRVIEVWDCLLTTQPCIID